MNTTPHTKTGLLLAFLLGLSDIAILAALTGDGDKPPTAIVVASVAIGVATLVLVALAWRKPTWTLMIGVIALRALSALGDVAAFGQDNSVLAISIIFLALCIIDIYLLRGWIKKHTTAHAPA